MPYDDLDWVRELQRQSAILAARASELLQLTDPGAVAELARTASKLVELQQEIDAVLAAAERRQGKPEEDEAGAEDRS